MANGEWFAPKRYGYGSGLPIAWQGWVVLAVYLIVTVGTVTLFPRLWYLWTPLTAVLTWGLIVIAARRTRGGWRWRWGDKD
ncbi:hypothetical protein FHS95_001436 [Sphingomonas naasensis]|uniref:DUF4175 domain-containing protein n=1 Tax=Sphingomonas naasensis TaxID=1344951 RepID=A0A4S1WC70_9SPHN|nr:hypothetical protein [Sphingomonas naasensis]NIJ19767.1 hypothetical protein [Sphingomonas naasensis]TGX40093.1 hypothetical protein E5A74_16115 [Sphingomonas naasensis]